MHMRHNRQKGEEMTTADRNGRVPAWITCTYCLNPIPKESLEIWREAGLPPPTQPRRHHHECHVIRWKIHHLDSVALLAKLQGQRGRINLLKVRLETCKAEGSPIPFKLPVSIAKQQGALDELQQDFDTLPEDASVDWEATKRECERYRQVLDRRYECLKPGEDSRWLEEEYARTGEREEEAKLKSEKREEDRAVLTKALSTEMGKAFSSLRYSLGTFISGPLRKQMSELLRPNAGTYAIAWRTIPEQAKQIYRAALKAERLASSIRAGGVVVPAVAILGGLDYSLQESVSTRVGFTLTDFQELGKMGTGEVEEVGDSLPYFEKA